MKKDQDNETKTLMDQLKAVVLAELKKKKLAPKQRVHNQKRVKLYGSSEENYMSCNLGNSKAVMDRINDILSQLFNMEVSKSVLISRMLDMYHSYLVEMITKHMGMKDSQKALSILLNDVEMERIMLYESAGRDPR